MPFPLETLIRLPQTLAQFVRGEKGYDCAQAGVFARGWCRQDPIGGRSYDKPTLGAYTVTDPWALNNLPAFCAGILAGLMFLMPEGASVIAGQDSSPEAEK